MKKQAFLLLTVIFIAAGLMIGAGIAQAKHKKGAGPCKADVEQFCKDVKPGKGGIRECLDANAANLSPECKGFVEKMEQKRQAFQAACGGDFDKLCKGEKEGKGHGFKCLVSQKESLSQSCASFLEEKRAKKEAFKVACKSDVQKLCPDMKAGKRHVWKCLFENQDKLSDNCKGMIQK